MAVDVCAGRSMRTVAWLVFAFCAGCAGSSPELDESKLVDLSYAFDEQTVYWPTATRFALKEVAHGHTAGGYFFRVAVKDPLIAPPMSTPPLIDPSACTTPL